MINLLGEKYNFFKIIIIRVSNLLNLPQLTTKVNTKFTFSRKTISTNIMYCKMSVEKCLRRKSFGQNKQTISSDVAEFSHFGESLFRIPELLQQNLDRIYISKEAQFLRRNEQWTKFYRTAIQLILIHGLHLVLVQNNLTGFMRF